MNVILQFVLKHGYSFLFAALFVHQVGVPMPGALLLLAAGALAAAGKLRLLAVVCLTIVACVSADWIWYEAGRRRGDKVLRFMHRFTRDPDSHHRRAKRVITRYGLALLLVAKFVPGLDAIAPPLAGTYLTSRVRFLALDSAGAALYAFAYAGLGYLFRHDLDRAAAYIAHAGKLLLTLALTTIGLYLAHCIHRRGRCHRESQLPVVPAAEPVGCGESFDMPCAILGGQENVE